MKITVLDGHNVNPGDVSWDCIARFGSLTVYDRTPSDLVIPRIGDSELILLNKISITRAIIQKCPNLKYIGVMATGYNVVDVHACSELGITVTNIPSYSTDAVAQHVFAFILNFTNLIQRHSDSVQNGGWIASPDFCYWLSPLTELAGKTLGIYGFGHIGQQVAKIARAFGMNVIVHVHSEKSFTGGEKTVSAEELFAQSDFLTLHAPMTSETAKIVNEKTIALMKKSAIIVNCARGGLADESAVRKALESKSIAGYAADVIEQEPMSPSCPLYKAPNCIITPHIAWAPKETRERLLSIEEANIAAFFAGHPQNVVS
jgi:glycerate dehydrogenase